MENSSNPTAAARVCVIPELIENILIHLQDLEYSHKDEVFKALFRLQRVSQTFRYAIIHQKQLRCAMFLGPTITTKAGNAESTWSDIHLNPLLQPTLDITYGSDAAFGDGWEMSLAYKIPEPGKRQYISDPERLLLHLIVTRDQGSWCNTLLSDAEVCIPLLVGEARGDGPFRYVECPARITLGDMVDTAMGELAVLMGKSIDETIALLEKGEIVITTYWKERGDLESLSGTEGEDWDTEDSPDAAGHSDG